jgi:hypothetical protein
MKGVRVDTLIVPASLRARIGADASEGLVEMFSLYQQFATDRYERRLIQEVSAVRIELERGLAGIRVDMERMQSTVLRWTVLLWFGQFAAITGVLSYMTGGR